MILTPYDHDIQIFESAERKMYDADDIGHAITDDNEKRCSCCGCKEQLTEKELCSDCEDLFAE